MTLLKGSLVVTTIALALELGASKGTSSPPARGALLVDLEAVRAPSSATKAQPAPAELPSEPALHAHACAPGRLLRPQM